MAAAHISNEPKPTPPKKEDPKKEEAEREKQRKHREELLDEALEETFPGSDVPSIPVDPGEDD